MLPFIQAKAAELGAKKCSVCGQLDISFGLSNGSKCTTTDCTGIVPKHSALKTMQYSLEVFRELAANYDDMRGNTADDRAFTSNLVQSLSNFLDPIQHSGKMPDDSDIARLQAYLKTMHVAMGSEDRLGGALELKFGKPSLGFGKKIYKSTVLTLAVCTLAFMYIMNYPVKAEKRGFFSRWFS